MKVHLFQPVVPHYRIPFFQALNTALNGNLTIWASPGLPDGPDSVSRKLLKSVNGRDDAPMRSLFNGRLLFQQGTSQAFRYEPDVIVLCGNARILSNLLILWKALRSGVAVVWWGHYRSSSSSSPGIALRTLLMRLCHAVLVYTDKEKEELCRHGFPASKLFFCNNALDVSAIDRAKAETTDRQLGQTREKYGIPLDKNIILFTGRLTTKADIGLLLDAAARLKRQREDFCYVIVGSGEQQPAIERKIAALNLGADVVLTGTLLNESDLAPLFGLASLYVYPGEAGLSLLHALYYGVPVIIHDNRNRHNPEADAFSEKVNGVTFEYKNAASLARQIEYLADHPKFLSVLQSRSADSVRQRFSIDTMVHGFLSACDAAKRAADP